GDSNLVIGLLGTSRMGASRGWINRELELIAKNPMGLRGSGLELTKNDFRNVGSFVQGSSLIRTMRDPISIFEEVRIRLHTKSWHKAEWVDRTKRALIIRQPTFHADIASGLFAEADKFDSKEVHLRQLVVLSQILSSMESLLNEVV